MGGEEGGEGRREGCEEGQDDEVVRVGGEKSELQGSEYEGVGDGRRERREGRGWARGEGREGRRAELGASVDEKAVEILG